MEKQPWVHGFASNSQGSSEERTEQFQEEAPGVEPVLLSVWLTAGLALVPVPLLPQGTCATASPQLWNNNCKKPTNYGMLTGESILVRASSSAVSNQGLKGSFKTGIKLQVPNF